MVNLHNIVETLCHDRGITIGKMCSDIGVSRGNLSDLKAGRTMTLSAKKLQKIADYFCVTVDYLLTGKEPAQKEKAPAQAEVSDDVGELLDEILQMLGEDDAISFNGKPMSNEAKELLMASLESNIKLADKISAMRQKEAEEAEE